MHDSTPTAHYCSAANFQFRRGNTYCRVEFRRGNQNSIKVEPWAGALPRFAVVWTGPMLVCCDDDDGPLRGKIALNGNSAPGHRGAGQRCGYRHRACNFSSFVVWNFRSRDIFFGGILSSSDGSGKRDYLSDPPKVTTFAHRRINHRVFVRTDGRTLNAFAWGNGRHVSGATAPGVARAHRYHRSACIILVVWSSIDSPQVERYVCANQRMAWYRREVS